MAREIYRKINGVWTWVKIDESKNSIESVAPAIVDDTLPKPLRHMVTGEICYSRTRLEQLNRENNVRCVGNDLLSKKSRAVKDSLTEEKVAEATEKALAISSNYDKFQEAMGKQREKQETFFRTINGSR